MGAIISIGNQKGGVGKTTTTAITGYLLSKKYKVLCVDFDS
ncbi:ParA family protein [Paenibacillus frigoriresistens]|nr:ParA family protein [Paenibacillus frigoriresistens]NRF92897.1 ParA family protein [Paenibacillus frigoriresistens]